MLAKSVTAAGLEIVGVYGIPVDESRWAPPDRHRFRCCLRTNAAAVIEGVEPFEISGGPCARRRVHGAYDQLPADIAHLYEALIEEGIEMRDAPAIFHYIDQPGAADGANVVHVTNIYVPA